MSDLSAEKRKLLEYLLAEEGVEAPAAQALPRRAEHAPPPLSFAQRRLWFIDQLQPGISAYIIAAPVRMLGALHVAALARSLDALAQRHEILRTSFIQEAGVPIQRIAPAATIALPVIDCSALAAPDRDAAVMRLVRGAARSPFDLAQGPLLRVLLLRLAPQEHMLFLALHHIVADGWSIGVVVRELAALYDIFCNRRPSSLPELAIQYADFAAWQHQWLQGELLDRLLAYWTQRLAGSQPLLDLPADRPRPAAQTYRGARYALAIAQPLTAALRQRSQAHDTTLFMLLLAAFQVLLYRYTGHSDISVGTPVANRNWAEVEPLIGLFANTLVMRARASGELPFLAFLERVRHAALESYEHQDLPFERLVEALRPARDLSYNPLYQVQFVLQNVPMPAFRLGDLTFHPIDLDLGSAQVDLTLNLTEQDDRIAGWFEYSTDLFDQTTIGRMATHLQRLLESIVANPAGAIAHLPILSAAERAQLMVEWNAAVLPRPPAALLHELVAAQVARTPDAIALVFQTMNDEERTMSRADRSFAIHRSSFIVHISYAELDARANRLAQHLRSLGVGPDARVGVSLARSPDLVISLLGVLKAGGAYVPLDPSYPAERIGLMLADSQARVLVTNDARCPEGAQTNDETHADDCGLPTDEIGHLVTLSPCHLVNLGADWSSIAAQPATAPHSAVDPANLAYVLFTSGSTGRPKGVAITHANAAALLAWAQATFTSEQLSGVLASTSINFDMSVFELFGCLSLGGTAILAEHALELPRLASAAQVTVLSTVPSALAQLLRMGGVPAGVRTVMLGGEPLARELVQQLYAQVPAQQVLNLYGPSEDTTYSTCAVLTHAPAEPPTIGRPVGKTQAYVLSRDMQPQPLGVPGELYLGGAGLARGYLGRPDLTAERFIPNPFAEVSGIGYRVLGAEPSDTQYPTPDTRLYKTGDLVRYRADGQLEFLGRLDYQVKVRGFRIEPDEVTVALREHPAVREAVVVARADAPGQTRLVAYVVPTEGTGDRQQATGNRQQQEAELGTASLSPVTCDLSPSELRAFLAARLPAYMLPSAFVVLDALPMTPSGKIDRRALPAPGADRFELEQPFVAPRTPIEELLAALWAEVLGVSQVGVDDNFFALGGHSLLATQVLAQVRAAFQVELPLRSLFEHPTVASLAERVDSARRMSLGMAAPPIRPIARDRHPPLSFAQERLWFLDQLAPGSTAYSIAVRVDLRGPLSLPALQRSLDMIEQRHEAVRTTFATVDGRPVQVIGPALAAPLPQIDLSDRPAAERADELRRLSRDLALRPFDLAHGPLVRATLVRLRPQEHALLLTTHHIVFDGSTDVFFGELSRLYTAYANGAPADLPALPIQYADYAAWQRAWLQGGVLETQLAYWKRSLAGVPALQLSTDFPRPAVQTFRGATQALALAPALAGALAELGRREGATLFMVLLGAFQTLLCRYSGQDDIAVGSPVSTRTRAEAENLIGCFVNTLVLRADLTGRPTFRELAKRVREVCLGAYAHQDMPFERLVEAVQPDRDLSRTPLFQVMFVLLHAARTEFQLADVQATSQEIDGGRARFELLLGLRDGPQGLQGVLEYNTDLFERSTIARLIGHFKTLLQAIAADPDQQVEALPLLTPAERQQLLREWNDTRSGVGSQKSEGICRGEACLAPAWLLNTGGCIHQLVEAQVARTPDAIACLMTGEERPKDEGRKTKDEGGMGEACLAHTQHLTYNELNERANRLARHLRELGVGPGALVAVYLDRAPEIIPALLAILKAGGAYVPLETSYPQARIAWIVGTLAIRCVITQTPHLPALAALDLPALEHVLCMDAPPARPASGWPWRAWAPGDWAHLPTGNLDGGAGADDLAYIIFTSGSTGTPKGVMVRHRPVGNLIDWVNRTFAVGPHDRLLFVTSLCFDLSVYDIFGLLAAGGAIHVAADRALREPQALARTLELASITFWDSAPAALQQLAPFFPPSPSTMSRLRLVFLSGDWIPLALPDQVRAAHPRAAVIGLGGATEATVWSNYYPIAGRAPRWVSIPYGRPIQNAHYHILDRRMQPALIGVAGDLYIAGACLAEGYAQDPALTAEKFIPNPFAELSGAGYRVLGVEPPNTRYPVPDTRLYKTGDRARYWPDGTIEFLGRLDQQVKIRGFRIELGEIEAALARHPSVRESVVLAREDTPGQRRLIAYVVHAEGTGDRGQETVPASRQPAAGSVQSDYGKTGSQPPSIVHRPSSSNGESEPSSFVVRRSSFVSELKSFLAAQLPDYMLPSAFVVLDAIPLTPNGKIDRRALPAPLSDEAGEERLGVAPRTPLEELLAGLWADVLGVARVSIHDNFFELGGHSLLASQLISRLRSALQIELPLRRLFEAPSVAGLVAAIASAQRSSAPPLVPVRRDGAPPLSFAQQRLWFLDQLTPNNPFYNILSSARLSGALDLAALQRCFNQIVERHEALRTIFATEAGQPVQIILPRLTMALPLIDLRALGQAEREQQFRQRIAQEEQQPFDLARGPLGRALLLRTAHDEHVLLLTLHHIISDGWSVGVFLTELSALYAAAVTGPPARLPDLPVQYADYAIWQRRWLRGAGDHTESPLQKQLAYWRAQLAGLPTLELPTDHPRPAVERYLGATQPVKFGGGLAQALTALSRRHGVTLFMTLLAAFQTLLARYSGQSDLAVGTPIAGRTRTELEGLVGFFANTLVLRGGLPGNRSFDALLEQARDATLRAYEHQDVPFEKLVEELQPERDLSRHPLFQVMLVLQNAPPAPLELSGLTMQLLWVESAIARFDLTLSLWEDGQELGGKLEYSRALFDAPTITRLLAHFRTLLEAIIADPARRLLDLPLLTNAEQRQLLIEWNDTASGVRGQESGVSSRGKACLAPTWLPASDSKCIHELFEAQVTRTPDAVACVTMNDEERTMNSADRSFIIHRSSFIVHLSYAELNARANRLAHDLRRLGIGPEALVGICLERSANLLIAVLGTLKAGGAILALDPTYPRERIAFMLEDSGVTAVLVARNELSDKETKRQGDKERGDHLVTLSPSHPVNGSSRTVVDLAANWPRIARRSATNPASGVTLDNLVYAMYTSGSTGQPKGIGVSHRAFANVLAWQRVHPTLARSARAVQFATFGFCVSFQEIFSTLETGAPIVMLPEAVRTDFEALLDLLERQAIERLYLPFAALKHLAEVCAARDRYPMRLRELITAGEQLQITPAIARWLDKAGVCVLHNQYGASETHVVSNYTLAGIPANWPAIPPIGRPIRASQIYLLDATLRPVPIGVLGEIHIGGPGLARGYLNDPGLTAERFIPNPFAEVSGIGSQESGVRSQESGVRSQKSEDEARHLVTLSPCHLVNQADTRLYRTGDLARYQPDGMIVYLGRIDGQIKIRGFRLELGEVEMVLRGHPAIGDVAVLVDERPGHGKRLVAYIVPTREQGTGDRGQGIGDSGLLTGDEGRRTNDESAPSFVVHRSSFVTELRGFLKERLPEYMVPSAFVMLERLPVNTNGKLDRAALPAPDTHDAALSAEFLAPRTAVEELLAQTWAAMLGREQVGIDDNFFELGGHSLLATQVVGRLREAFAVELPLRDLFEAPTVAELAARVEELRRGPRGLRAPPILPLPRDGDLSLSFAQQRLWFLDQLEPDSPLYIMPLPLRLDGPLDAAALARSLRLIVARHEALRTTFAERDGQPVQMIAAAREARRRVALPVIDLRALPGAAREDTALRLAANDARRPFDLGRGPLLRAALLRLGAREHVLLLSMHHIVADGWSLGVFVREIAALYAAESTNASGNDSQAALPPLPIQYADYAVWQRAWLQGEILERQLAYWRRQLENAPTALELPIDRPRPAHASFQGVRRAVALPRRLSDDLLALSRREGVTLFMTLLAAWQTLLARYSGQTDILVGTPVANRGHAATETLIGFFVNTLVLRSDLRENPSSRALLRHVREVCLGAYDHQELPFEQVVEALAPARDLSRHPLFQVMFALQNAPMPALECADLTLRPLAVDSGTVKFDLTLTLESTDLGLQGALGYATELFDATTIQRLLGHFQTLLESIAAQPERRIGELALLTTAEQRQLLVEWNDTAAGIRSGRGEARLAPTWHPTSGSGLLHELFAAQAARSPDAVAVVFDPGTTNDERTTANCRLPTADCRLHITYGELDARANQLAHYLRGIGVGPDTRVGICMERSLELLVGLLGVLKAGGAYLPLDPGYPVERITFMLDDAQPAVLLTNDERRTMPRGRPDERTTNDAHGAPRRTNDESDLLVTLSPCHLVNLAADWPAIARSPDTPPESGATPDHLAYLIYTSGSTGRPKGVMISHRGICNRLRWGQATYRLLTDDRVMQKAPFSFDASVWEIFWPLASGARLVLARPGGQQDSAYLAELIARQQITIIHFVPSMLRIFLEQPGWERCRSLRRVFCGGEPLPRDVQADCLDRLAATLHNQYGPTEASANVSFWTCRPGQPQRSVPIGRPIANMRIYLLDPHMQPVPIGVAGELHIGGVGLARGYLARPELTAARFIPNPFAEVSGIGYRVLGAEPSDTRYPAPDTRLYKTSDLARYRSDGAIEFLGRTDAQVKVRGFRVEPGEVEAVLRQHPSVYAVAVLAREDDPGEPRLVAYIVQESGVRSQESGDAAHEPLTPDPRPLIPELRSFLKERLPAYMLPSAFVLLDALPLSPNGKLDRRALPAPGGRRPDLVDGFAAPRSAIEQLLAGIWSEVLHVDQVGRDDNFFALGGDSLLCLKVVVKARQAGLRITPRQLFERQTVATLAAVAGAEQIGQPTAPLSGPIPLTPIQRWFFEQPLPDPRCWNQTFLLDLRLRPSPAHLARITRHLLKQHDALRLRFTYTGGGWQQRLDGTPDAIPFACDLAELPEASQAIALAHAVAAMQASLDISRGPLLRVALFDLGAERPSRLLIVTHALVLDGVSYRILSEDIQTAYAQLSRGAPIDLPPATSPFPHWAARLPAYAQSEALGQELPLWLDAPPDSIQPLPLDFANDANTPESARTVPLALSADETRMLLHEAPAAYHAQVQELLLAALALTMARWTRAPALLVDIRGHGRAALFDDLDLSRTVGWFTTIYPLLVPLAESIEPRAALQAVKAQLRRIPQGGVGYGLLRYLGAGPAAEQLRARPQAQIGFNYQGQFDSVAAESLFAAPARIPVDGLWTPGYLFEVQGGIAGDQLRLAWKYSQNMHQRTTAEALAHGYLEALRELIAGCRAPDAGTYSPADFPLADLSQQDLKRIMTSVRAKK